MAPVVTRPDGGEGKIVEVDETYIGNKLGRKLKGKNHPGTSIKHTVCCLVERGGPVLFASSCQGATEQEGRAQYPFRQC